MSEIKPNDKVLYNGKEHRVIAVDQELDAAWIYLTEHFRGVVVAMNTLTKIEPFFQVNRRYRYKVRFDSNRYTWIITHIHELAGERIAIGARYRTSDDLLDGVNAWSESEFREVEEVL